MPRLRTVRPKWALTTTQAEALLAALPPLARTLVGVALLSGLRRGELFALRWRDLDEGRQCLTVREAVYEGAFDTPKTAAGLRRMPLSAWRLIHEWRPRAICGYPDASLFSTGSGKPIAPNNVLRRWVFPACDGLTLPRATWLTFRRTYASWAHDKGVAGKVVAQLMGHANVDTTLNVHAGARRIGAAGGRDHRGRIVHELFTTRRDDGADPLNS